MSGAGARLPANPSGHEKPSAAELFGQEPARFSLDQATQLTTPHVAPADARYRSTTRLGAAAGEALPGAKPGEIIAPTLGLLGPGGVMPRHYTALVDRESRRRSTALHSFVDMLARRFVGLFVQAGRRYRPTRDPALTETALSSLVGLGTPQLTPALETPLQAVLYHAGNLANRTRSAERVRGMLAEEIGAPVRIREFAGAWVPLPPAEQSRFGAGLRQGRFMRLGVDATAGSQVWDPAARFHIEVGPLSLPEFNALLPGSRLHGRLSELVRLHVGLEQDFAFNPILAAEEVPTLRLGGELARMGWSTWLTAPKPRTADAADAVLPATTKR